MSSDGCTVPAWTRTKSLGFSQANGGLAPSTLAVLNFDGLSHKARDAAARPAILSGAAGTAARKVAGEASRTLVHHSGKNKSAEGAWARQVPQSVLQGATVARHLNPDIIPAARGFRVQHWRTPNMLVHRNCQCGHETRCGCGCHLSCSQTLLTHCNCHCRHQTGSGCSSSPGHYAQPCSGISAMVMPVGVTVTPAFAPAECGIPCMMQVLGPKSQFVYMQAMHA